MFRRRDGARFPPDVRLGILIKEFNLGFIRPENLVSHGLRVLQVPFGKLQAGCHVPFTEDWFPSGHSTIKAWLVECCRDGCLSGRFSHLHRGTLELCQTDHCILGHLPDQGPSLLFAQFGRAPALGQVLVAPDFFHLRMMEATVFLGIIKECK